MIFTELRRIPPADETAAAEHRPIFYATQKYLAICLVHPPLFFLAQASANQAECQ